MWVELDLKTDFNSASLLLLDMQAKKQEEPRHLCIPNQGAHLQQLASRSGAGGNVEEPGVLPLRNGAGAASRSRGSGRRGLK
jgi:hypothetical protein